LFPPGLSRYSLSSESILHEDTLMTYTLIWENGSNKKAFNHSVLVVEAILRLFLNQLIYKHSIFNYNWSY